MIRTLFVDPLAVKELSGVARRWQSYVSRMVYVALIATILVIYWVQLSERAAWMSPSEYALLGRTLFYFFAGLQILFVTLAGISAASDLVTREVKAGTLGLLALTPLTPWRIAAGKWKAAMAQSVSVILCGVPVLAICVFLGGVGPWQLLWCTSLSVAAAAMGSALSLLFSSLVRSGVVVVLLSLGVLFLYNLLPGLIIASGGSSEAEWMMAAVCCVHVHYAFVGAMMSMEVQLFRSFELLGYAWIPATAATFLLTFVLLRLASARVRSLLQFPATPRPPEVDLAADGPSRPVWQRHALFWKELRTTAFGRIRRHVLIALGLVMIVLLPLSAMIMQSNGPGAAFLWLGSIVLLFLAMARGAGLFVQEREDKQWEVLLSTPLTPREILASKLLAGGVPLLPYSVLFFGTLWLFSLAHRLGLGGWVMSTGSLVLAAALAYVVGGWASLRARNLRASFSLTFGLVLLWILVIPVLLLIVTAVFDLSLRENEFPLLLIQMTNPAPFIIPLTELLARASDYDGWRSTRVADAYSKLGPFFVVYVAVYGGLIALFLAFMRIGFARATGRV